MVSPNSKLKGRPEKGCSNILVASIRHSYSHIQNGGTLNLLKPTGYVMSVGKLLCYKSEGRWFDPSWCSWNFSLT